VANRAGPRARRVDVAQVFECPRQVLFTVWTDPQHFSRWWGPELHLPRYWHGDAQSQETLRFLPVGFTQLTLVAAYIVYTT
jgi:uncharacterized protein YndB with AHSA1/START domain